ncbi:MAG: Lar family restriction alleviation protein [Candidatus Saccharibacteria bacterium]|nr:Lar family restriction alleviation protein [Candidatus Saccharibacteria bacterium]
MISKAIDDLIKANDELLPCPFCGSEARSYSYGIKASVVHCSNESCHVRPEIQSHGGEDVTINMWNARDDRCATALSVAVEALGEISGFYPEAEAIIARKALKTINDIAEGK